MNKKVTFGNIDTEKHKSHYSKYPFDKQCRY